MLDSEIQLDHFIAVLDFLLLSGSLSANPEQLC